MSIATKIGRIERALGGGDDGPRRIVVWYGLHYRCSWIQRRGASVSMFLRVPDVESHPWDHLPDAMLREIRPTDELVFFHAVQNHRDDHLQLDVPPWRRKPWRSAGPNRYELETSPGTWEAMEVAR